MLVCMSKRAIIQLFSKMTLIFLKLPFTMIISTLLLLLFKEDEAFHIVRVRGKPLSTHLDSFYMLTTKSKLKNAAVPAVPPPRCDSGAHIDAAPFQGRAKGNCETFYSQRALLGPTASNMFHHGDSTHTFPAPHFHVCRELKVNRDQNFKVRPRTQNERPEQIQKGVPVVLSLASLTRKQWQDILQ